MNVQKQTGTSDCGLFTIAAVTCLLFDGDSTAIVFNQKELHLHFTKILETKISTASRKNKQSTTLIILSGILYM